MHMVQSRQNTLQGNLTGIPQQYQVGISVPVFMYIGGCKSLGVSTTLWVWVYLISLVFGYDETMWVKICSCMCQGRFLHLTMTANVTLSVTVDANKTVNLTYVGKITHQGKSFGIWTCNRTSFPYSIVVPLYIQTCLYLRFTIYGQKLSI